MSDSRSADLRLHDYPDHLAAVLEDIWSVYGVRVSDLERLDGGLNTGAFRVRLTDPQGQRRAVLKVGGWGKERWLDRVLQAERIAQRLRPLGYPLPGLILASVCGGAVYQVYELLPGHDVHSFTPALADNVLALNRLQAGQGNVGDTDWSEWAHGVVFDNADGGMASLTGDARTRDVVLSLRRSAARLRGVRLGSDDVVHGDYSATNFLAIGSHISGVVDFDAAGRGSRAIDLGRILTMQRGAPRMGPALERVRAEIIGLVGADGLALILAYEAMGLMEFALRHGDPGRIAHALEVGAWVTAEIDSGGWPRHIGGDLAV